MPVSHTTLQATIASGASLSDALDLIGYDLVGIEMPAAWTAAAITLQSSSDGVTYRNVYSASGTELSLTVDASRYVHVDSTVAGLLQRFVKIRSGTAAVPVNQAAARLLGVYGRAEV